MATQSLCSIPGCDKPHHARGWCSSHYHCWRNNGDPTRISRTPQGETRRYLTDVVMNYDGDDCLLWPFSSKTHGYAVFKVDGKSCLVSRYICEKEYGPPPTAKHQAAHSCGKGHLACVTKRHLSWKTPAENQADKIIHGTHNRGVRNGSAKLTEPDIDKIRSLKGAMSQRAIARLFGVTPPTIGSIHRGKAWSRH